MCSRFELNCRHDEVTLRFGLMPPLSQLPYGEVRPTDPALVIGPGGRPLVLRWGLAARWSPRPLINARAETVTTKFARLLARRCLVPATAWFEWRKDGKARIKTRLRPRLTNAPFALAGLEDGERFVVLTCPAAPDAAAVHDRMPVLLAPEDEAAWLDPATAPGELARPYGGPLSVVEEGGAPPRGLFD